MTRARDEQIIEMCALHAEGYSYKQIGEIMGLSKNAAISAVRKVMLADMAESGEPPSRVRAAYEWTAE
jgi:hypothetical protein